MLERVISVVRGLQAGELRFERCEKPRLDRLLRKADAMIRICEALMASDLPKATKPWRVMNREQTIALGALFMLGLREQTEVDIIERAGAICEELVVHLERQTKEQW